MEYELKGFWDKVDVKSADECWNWTKGTSCGYDQVRYNKGRIYETKANRIAWMLHNQMEVPKGLYICHTCDNKLCCNPAHLYAGTPKDNMQDAAKRGKSMRQKRCYGIVEGLARLANNK